MGKLMVMDTMGTGTLRLALTLATALIITATGCVFRSNEGGGSTTAKPPPQPQLLAVDELVAAVTAGEATPIVQSWFRNEKPLVEAYSFLEYAMEYGPGEAYYWGEWQTRSDNYCAVRMQKNYLPVSLDLTLGWYAAATGANIADLYEQYLEIHTAAGGTVEEITGHADERVGDRYTLERDGTRVELLTRDDMPAELTILAIQLTLEKLTEVMVATRRYPQFQVAGTADHDSTLTELIELIDGERALGLLNRFDFSGFQYHQVFTPAHEAEHQEYTEASFYQSGSWWWAAKNLCIAGVYDEGTRTQLLFTPAWYAEHCGHSAEELAAEFEVILAGHPHTRFEIDAEHDEYDVEYAFTYIGEVNLIRRRYTSGADGNQVLYMLLSGPPVHSGAPDHVPGWTAADLPASAEPGPLEGFIKLLAKTSIADLRGKYLYNFELTNINTRLHEPQPFTTRQRLELADHQRMKLLCRAFTMDQTFLEKITFTPVWFEQVTGGSADGLAADFAALMVASGGNQAAADAGKYAESFNFGPFTVSRDQGNDGEGYDTWYRIEVPTWP